MIWCTGRRFASSRMARHVFEVQDADGACLSGHGRGAWKPSSGRPGLLAGPCSGAFRSGKACTIIPETLEPGWKAEIGRFCLLAALPELAGKDPAALFGHRMQIPDAGENMRNIIQHGLQPIRLLSLTYGKARAMAGNYGGESTDF